MLLPRWYRYVGWACALWAASACAAAPASVGGVPSALDPHGPAAAQIAELWWLMLGLGSAVFILVVALMSAALLRRRSATSSTPPESHGDDTGRRWAVWGGIVLPLVVISTVFGYSIHTLVAIEDPAGPAQVKIEVVGWRWWWQVIYPGAGLTTANEIHIPVGVPVQIKLEAGDVIHSFWVPELAGKMDLIPTRVNYLTLQADQAGVYRGQCAEFCGLEHAHMGMLVIAQSSDEFNRWLQQQQATALTPTAPAAARGQQVFLSAGCVYCHTVRGLDDRGIVRASVDLGPDLTHVYSRQTIAGASLAVNNGNLAGWVVDPQHVKPGSLMPNNSLNSQDLQDLLAYLGSLQ